MMRDEHVTEPEIAKLARRELAATEVLRVARHLETCAVCRAQAHRSPAAQMAGEVFDFDDLDQSAVPPRRARRRLIAVTAAAAAVAAAIVIVFTMRVPVPAQREVPTAQHHRMVASTPLDAAWDAAMRDALSHGIARPAILDQIRPPADALRGRAESEQAALHPSGVVIDDAQPVLTWTPFHQARYIVAVSAGDRVVASSSEIASPSWTPPSPLPRATALTWQVEVRRGARTEIIPAPPRPPALLWIVDEQTARDLAEARRRRPNDHLLLGILYARAGMLERAREELQTSGSPEASRILSGLHRW